MMRSTMACGLLCLVAGSAYADVYPDVQYKSYLTRAQSVEPVADFGEQVSLRDGSLSTLMQKP